jgi:biopolymer transport protein ExbB
MRRLSTRTLLTTSFGLVFAVLVAAGPVFAQSAPTSDEISLTGMFLNPTDLFAKLMIWCTILLSVYGFSMIIRYGLNARKVVIMPATTVDEVERLLTERKYKEVLDLCNADASVFAKTMGAALGNAVHGFGAMRESAEEVAYTKSAAQIRSMEILNILGAAGPMIGLFGTVYGMIMAFYAMAKAGGAPKPAELAGGISAALVSTFWGLVVAIPAVLAYGMIRVTVENNIEEAFAKVIDLIKPFRPVPTKR